MAEANESSQPTAAPQRAPRRSRAASAPATTLTEAAAAPSADAAPATAPAKRAPRTRSKAAADTAVEAALAAPAQPEAEPTSAPAKRAAAKKAPAKKTSAATEAEASAEANAGGESTASAAESATGAPAEKAPAKKAQSQQAESKKAPAKKTPARKAAAKKVSATTADGEAAASAAEGTPADTETAAAAGTKTAKRAVRATQAQADDAPATAETPAEAEPKKPARKRATKKSATAADAPAATEAAQDGAGTPEAAEEQEPAAKTPRKRTTRSRTAAAAREAAAEAKAVRSSDDADDVDAAPAETAENASQEAEAEAPTRRRRASTRKTAETAATADADDATEGAEDAQQLAAAPSTPEAGPEGEPEESEDAASEPVVFDPFAIPTDLAAVLTVTPEHRSADEADEAQEGTRRRRRRRRGTEDMEIEEGNETDPPGTITRVRAPRSSSEKPVDHVVAIKGSTRLEAKRQRRRESRESGRRRHGITEAEFLARRESVDRKMVVRQKDERIQIGVLEDGVLAEHFVSHTTQDSMIGNVYVGKVQNVLPSMEAAFVDIGRGRNAVLYAGEVDWDAAKLDGKPRRIENALKSGDTVLVQVTKDPVGHKGARLTSQISLPGRYLVYVPGGSMTGISRKLPDVERNRLKKILKDHLPDKAGVIVRTAAEGAAEQELMNDINRLRVQWEGILKASTSTKTRAPELLYAEPDLTIKVVRDVFNEDFSKLIVQGEHAWDTIEAYVTYVAPDLVDRLEQWAGEEDVFSELRIDEQIRKALDRKVNLPSGGSLVIDRTEAMTVIDVNTGKFTGSGGNLEETVTKNNLEAAEEIVRQMRLRDMGGIIVVDFIDMVLESNRDLVLRRLVECLGRDRTKHQVAEVTSLGLVQMTRKKIGTGLLEVFSEPCEHCDGRGVVLQDEPLAGRSRPQHVHTPSERPTRSERAERRKASQQPAAPAPKAAEPVKAPEPTPEEQERAQKTRSALASIAAASTHAHEGEHAGGHTDAQQTAPQAVAEGGHGPEGQDGFDDDGKPRRRRRRGRRGRGGRGQGEDNGAEPQADAEDTAGAAEASAAQAGERDTHAADVVQAPAAPAQPEQAQLAQAERAVAAQEPAVVRAAPQRRRRRAASSEQGSTSTQAVSETQVSGSTASSAAPQRASGARRSTPQNAEPVMLGVGVPASEL